MASIERHGSGWRVVWREGGRGSPKRSRTCPDRRTAEALARDVAEQLALVGTWSARPSPIAPSLRATLHAWLDSRAADLHARTIVAYDGALRLYVASLAGDDDPERVPVSALTRASLGAFRAALLREGMTPTTAYKRASVVLQAWRDIETSETARWLTERAPRRLDGRKPRGATVLDVPTWEDLDLLHGALVARGAPAWTVRLWILLRCTGLRRSEALLLRWEDLDLGAGRLVIRATKGDLSPRRVPLAPILLPELRTWERSSSTLVGAPEPELQAARGRVTPEGRLYRGHADRTLRRAWAATGVREEVWRRRPAHCVRRTWETHLVAMGGAPEAVGYLVGHQPQGTGPRWYADTETRLWPALVAAVGLVPQLAVSAMVGRG